MIAFWRKQGRLRKDGETGNGSWNPSRTEADGGAWGEQVGQKTSGTKPGGRQGQDPVAGQQPPIALSCGGAWLNSSLRPPFLGPPPHPISAAASWLPTLCPRSLTPYPAWPALPQSTDPTVPCSIIGAWIYCLSSPKRLWEFEGEDRSTCSLEHPQLRTGSGNSTEVGVVRGG